MIALVFDTPWFLAALVAMLPVIAFFLLKRKRRDVPVSSSMLWQRALKETMARTPFRKPSEWLSLLLMLLALAGVVFGSAGLRLGSGGGGRALVLVVDVSASMSLEHEGESRIGIARAKAAEALDALKDGDQVTVIAAGTNPRVLVHATADIAAARRVLDDVQAEPVGCDMRSAMSLAFAEGRDGAEIVVLSDFCHDQDSWADLPDQSATITLVQCGQDQPNVGITYTDVSADDGGVSVLVRVAGDGARTLSLLIGDALTDAREVVCGGEEITVVFNLPNPPEEAGEFQRATLKLEPADDLKLDDTAFISIGRTDPPRILHVGAADPFIMRLEAAVPGLVVNNVSPGSPDIQGRYDLAIVTEQTANIPPARCELYIGCVPPGLPFVDEGEIAQPELADWDSTHPLLRGVGLENLLFARARKLSVPRKAIEIVKFRDGPLLLELRADGRETYTWSCGLNDSNLVLRPAFPVFIRNLLGEAIHRVQGRSMPCSRDLTFSAPGGDAAGEHDFQLRLPDGDERTAHLLAGEAFTQRAPQGLGFYSAAIDGTPSSELGTGLYSLAETSLKAAPPKPPEKSEVEVVSASAWTLERPVWRWCAAVAILALLAELALWLVKNRRI